MRRFLAAMRLREQRVLVYRLPLFRRASLVDDAQKTSSTELAEVVAEIVDIAADPNAFTSEAIISKPTGRVYNHTG